MKIRILNNSIRLRLTKPEVKIFGEKGFVEAGINFGGRAKLKYSLASNMQKEVTAFYESNSIRIIIPREITKIWVNSDQVGIKASIALPEGEQLSILIEKDFKCLSEREGENESDMFPHPNEGDLKC